MAPSSTRSAGRCGKSWSATARSAVAGTATRRPSPPPPGRTSPFSATLRCVGSPARGATLAPAVGFAPTAGQVCSGRLKTANRSASLPGRWIGPPVYTSRRTFTSPMPGTTTDCPGTGCRAPHAVDEVRRPGRVRYRGICKHGAHALGALCAASQTHHELGGRSAHHRVTATPPSAASYNALIATA